MTLSLAQALDAVADVASSAGLDPSVARTEAAQLAAAIAESSQGSFQAWAVELGRPANAEEFFTEAMRGRRYRTAPVPGLAELIRQGSPRSIELAKTLSDVCAAAATLGVPSPQAATSAQLAAASQYAAMGAPSAPRVRSEERLFLNQAPAILTSVLSQMEENSRRILDLRGTDPLGPGAFPGLPGGQLTPPSLPATAVNPGVSATGNAPAVEPATPLAATGETPKSEEKAPEEPPKTLDELLAELDGLIGLASVKDEIHRQAAILKVEGLRVKAGLKSPTITRHLVFVGNPGTGKTTVARLVGGIYRALGLLSKGQLVEVDRSELVAGYLGQTAIKTSEMVAKAEGGVLFIDEAYSLNGDQYGEEAINTLVKEMEDKRDNLVVIVAGYTQPMAVFISENPGLASRFRTTIEFPDYSDGELVQIFTGMATKSDYVLGEGTEKAFRDVLAVQVRDSTFGNGRFARNVFENAVGRHAWRLRDVADPTVDQLQHLLPEDIEAPPVEEAVPWPPAEGTSEAPARPSSEPDVPVDKVATA